MQYIPSIVLLHACTVILPAPQPVNATAEVISSDIMMNVQFTITIVCHEEVLLYVTVTVDGRTTLDGRVMPVHSYEIENGEMKFEIEDLPPGNTCSDHIW